MDVNRILREYQAWREGRVNHGDAEAFAHAEEVLLNSCEAVSRTTVPRPATEQINEWALEAFRSIATAPTARELRRARFACTEDRAYDLLEEVGMEDASEDDRDRMIVAVHRMSVRYERARELMDQFLIDRAESD